jgi:hypothetical protein
MFLELQLFSGIEFYSGILIIDNKIHNDLHGFALVCLYLQQELS